MGIKIESDKIMLKFTAGADISKGQVVYVSDDNEVSPATDAEAAKCVGVADNDASAGEEVYVIIYGKATVVADGAISAGDRVRAASTAGRVVSESTCNDSCIGIALSAASAAGESLTILVTKL